MTTIEKEFLCLVRAGVWRQRAEVLIPPNHWSELMQMSDRQSLLAVAFDGMQSLLAGTKDSNAFPPTIILMNWFGQTSCAENQNDTINKDVARLVRFMNRNDIEYRLMKGQGCSVYYPNPRHRQCGDIDLFVGKEHYELAKDALIRAGVKIKRETMKDAQYMCGDSLVEMHWTEIHFYSARLNKVLQQICRKEEWQRPKSVYIEGEEVLLFNATFNVFYIFVHLYHHFLQVGVGLRQICDWMLMMQKEEANIDWQKLESWLKDIEALKAWTTFYGLTVEYLGQHLLVVPEWMLGWKQKDVEFVLQDIMAVGNFGKYGESIQRREFKGGLWNNVSSFMFLLKRLWKVQRFGRREVWAYPVWKLKNDVGIWQRYVIKNKREN